MFSSLADARHQLIEALADPDLMEDPLTTAEIEQILTHLAPQSCRKALPTPRHHASGPTRPVSTILAFPTTMRRRQRLPRATCGNAAPWTELISINPNMSRRDRLMLCHQRRF